MDSCLCASPTWWCPSLAFPHMPTTWAEGEFSAIFKYTPPFMDLVQLPPICCCCMEQFHPSVHECPSPRQQTGVLKDFLHMVQPRWDVHSCRNPVYCCQKRLLWLNYIQFPQIRQSYTARFWIIQFLLYSSSIFLWRITSALSTCAYHGFVLHQDSR